MVAIGLLARAGAALALWNVLKGIFDVLVEVASYSELIEQIGGTKHVAPHAIWAAALWSVLTRLKKPNSVNYSPTVSAIVSGLTPLEKSRLYDQGELPASLSAEDRKILRSNIEKVRDEYQTVPYYEGRTGASAREVKSILFDAARGRTLQTEVWYPADESARGLPPATAQSYQIGRAHV